MSTAHTSSRQGGFTLIELLIAIAALAIVAAAISPFLTNFLRMNSSGSVDSLLLQEGRWASDTIARELAYANQTVAPPTIGVSSLSFKVPGNANTITYSLINNEVCRQAGAGTVQRPLTDAARIQVSALTFTSNPDYSITIHLQVQGTDISGRLHTRVIDSRVYCQN